MKPTQLTFLTKKTKPIYYMALTTAFTIASYNAIAKLLALPNDSLYFSITLLIGYGLLVYLPHKRVMQGFLLISLIMLFCSTKSLTVIYNDFAAYLGIHYGVYLRQFATDTTAVLATITIALLISLALSQTVRRRFIYPYALVFIFILLGQLFTRDMLSFHLNSILLLLLLGICIAAKMTSGKRLVMNSLAVVLCSLIVLSSSYFIPKQQSPLHEKTVAAVQQIVEGKNDTDWKTNGHMQQLGQQSSSKSTVMTVIMEKPTALYLKGFIGSHYAKNEWTPLSNKTYYEAQALFENLAAAGFSSETMLAKTYAMTATEKATALTIYPEKHRGQFSYIPYESLTPLQRTGLLKDGIQQSSQSKQSYQIMENAYIMYPVTAQQEKNSTFLQAEGHYNEFVYANYLQIGKEEQKIINTHLQKQTKKITSYDEAIKIVTGFLSDNMRYAKNPSPVTAKENFVQSILENNKRGYAPHYATLATLLFRQLGIPARYVEGYVVTKDLIESKKAYSEINITGKEAHAWTEIYMDQLGWVPVEVTPGYAQKMPKLETPKGIKQSLQSQTANTIKDSQTPGEQIGKKERIQDIETTLTPTKKKEQYLWPVYVKILVGIASVLLFITSSLACIIAYKRRRVRRLKKAMRSADQAIKAKANIAYIEWQFSQILQLEKPNSSLFSWLEVLPKHLQNPMLGVIREYQKLYYGQMTDDERLQAYLQQLQQIMQRPLSKWQRILYYVKGGM